MAINYNKPNEIRDFRNGSWFWIQTHVWRDKRLGKADKVTYGTLTSYANTSQEMYPSINRIAEDSDLSPRQVYRCIKHLESLGYIIIERSHGKSNLYKLAKTYEAPENEKRPHPTPDTMSPLTKSTLGDDKSTLGTPDKSTLRTISNITISNNNSDEIEKLINKIITWAYFRSPNRPSITPDSYEKSVRLAIGHFGVDRIYKLFENETNAISFLVNIKG